MSETETKTAHHGDINGSEGLQDRMCMLCLPEPPERPLDSDCCGGGCIPCVMDIYHEELAMWEEECERLRTGICKDENGVAKPEDSQDLCLHSNKYTAFPIIDVTQETPDIVRIRCSLARKQTLGLRMGQHIIIRSKAASSSMTRQYTPISPLETKGYFELLIKIYPEGRMSQHVKTWKVGDKLEARGPAGQLTYSRNKYRRILMLCAGTGVAPMCQVISSVLSDEDDETYLRLVYACSSYSHLMAKAEIDEWRRFWNFSCLFVLSQEPDWPAYNYKYGEEVHRGHVDKEMLCRELDNNPCHNVLVLVCGTRSFDTDMMNYLSELGIPETNIHKF